MRLTQFQAPNPIRPQNGIAPAVTTAPPPITSDCSINSAVASNSPSLGVESASRKIIQSPFAARPAALREREI